MIRKKKNNKFDKYRKVNPEQQKRKRLFAIVIAVILAVLVLAQAGLYQERRKLQAEKTKIERQISKEEERGKELQKEKKHLSTKEFIEKIARERFKLFYPDEYVFEED